MLGVKGPNSPADAYGIVTAEAFTFPPPHDAAQIAGFHLIIKVNAEDRDRDPADPSTGLGNVEEVSFDEADIQGTFHVPGHPGVIGLWLDASSSSTIADPVNWSTFDPTQYEVPDLAPADNGYMYVRGLVWPPGQPGMRSYP